MAALTIEAVEGFVERSGEIAVGDRATVEMLRVLGVDYAQGFEVGRPRPLVPLMA